MKKITLYLCTLIFITATFSYLLPNYYDPWRTVYHEYLMFATFLLLFIKILIDHPNLQINRKIISIFIISLIPLMQNIFGKIYFFGDALIAFIYIFSFGIAVLIGINLRRNLGLDKIIRFISGVFICAGLISSYIILKQWLLLSNGGIWSVDLPSGGRPFANFAQPNNCASFLLLSALATLYIFEKKIINHLSAIGLIVLLLFCLALTQSRAAWVFIICFLVWWFWKINSFSARLSKYLIFCPLGVLILFIWTIPYLSSSLEIISTSDIITRVTTGYQRIPMWHQMLLAISDEPIWGYGWNQVSVAQLSIYLKYPISVWTEHSHNIFLDLLIWNGVPIGSTIIAFFIIWLWQLSKLTKSVEIFIGLAMMGVLIVHSMFEYPLEYAFFLLPMGLILGALSFDLYDEGVKFFSKNIGMIVFIISTILFTWIFIEYRCVEEDTRLLQFELKNIGETHAIQDAPNIMLLTQLRERIRFLRTQPQNNITQEQMIRMRQVTYRYGDSINLYKYAQLLLLNNKRESAKRYLLILSGMHQKEVAIESLYNINDSLNYKWKRAQVLNHE